MKIGYFVQGANDESLVIGFAQRWCPDATLAPGRFRGRSKESLRRELGLGLHALQDKDACDVIVVLTDADDERWQDVKRRESARIPQECQHVTVFGVADRNIECWLRLDAAALASEIDCRVEELQDDDPKGLVDAGFRRGVFTNDDVRERIAGFVRAVNLRAWLSDQSFGDFYGDVRTLANRRGCFIPDEYQVATT